MRAPIPLLAGLFLSAGCNNVEFFHLAGYNQESFSNDADILFVVDNSSSMEDEAQALALNFDVFVHRLTNPTGEAGQGGLTDAVDAYIEYTQQRDRILDYQLAITTTDVATTYGALYGDPALLAKGDPSVPEDFSTNLLCTATCFNSSQVPHDPDYSCGDPLGDVVSVEYLDCVCGEDAWRSHCGGGQEEGLEAVYMAMCRAVEDPPPGCFEDNQFTEADVLSNDGLIRPGATLIPVIVTDEGDTSRRLSQGEGNPEIYAELFAEFDQRMSFAVIGPSTQVCNSGGATTWGVARYEWFVDETGGSWFDIAAQDDLGECGVTGFAGSLEALGVLLNSLIDMFPLRGIPDVNTLMVFVDGEEVLRAESYVNDETGDDAFTSGWSYLAAENAVAFHGDAVPDYNDKVEIYYLPLEGMPRELPF